MRRAACRIAIAWLLGSTAAVVHAQMMIDRAHTRMAIEGFANTTVGHSFGKAVQRSTDLRIDAGIRMLILERVSEDTSIGVRAEALSSPEDNLQAGERGAVAIGAFGRFELGNRAALPVPIVGYGPNNYTFTSSEYGVESGRRLDPGGTLPTAFLTPALARQIDRISTMGFASTLFRDQSRKLVYVAPKTHGFQAGAAYSPDAEQQQGRYRQLWQAGLTHETFLGQSSYKIGGTFSHARGNDAGGAAYDDLISFSFGASASVHNRWTLGAALSYDGETGLQIARGRSYRSPGLGISWSVAYNEGPWTVGGYVQRARSAGDTARPGDDRLSVLELGASYRVNVHARLYCVAYRYRFDNEGGTLSADRARGTVVLAGLRLAL